MLTKSSADLKSSDGYTPLYMAVQGGHLEVVETLVKEGKANVDMRNGDLGRTALHKAGEDGNADVIKYLVVEAKASVDLLSGDNLVKLFL